MSEQEGRGRPQPPNGPPELLAGQKALVTGASSGIGRACAIALAEAGADVAVNYRGGKDKAEEVVERIRETGRSGLAVQADVAREEDVQGMFREVISAFGTIDILVNNAGMQQDAPFEEMTIEQWNRVLGVNLTGQFLCTREAVKEFKRRGIVPEVSCAAGKVICMSSVHEAIPWAGHVNYAASKGGVMLMARSIAQELAPDHIRVNSVAPGAVRTPINRDAWETQEAYDRLMELVPYNRIGEIGRAHV